MERKTYSNRHSELEPHPLPTLCMFKGLIVNPSFLATIFFSLLHFLSPLHFLPPSLTSHPPQSHSSSSEDYAHLVTSSTTERRILWLRVAIIENSLVTIVNEIIKNAESVSLSLHLLSPFFFSLLFLLSLSSSSLLSTPHSFMFYMRQWLSVIASTVTKSADQHSIDIRTHCTYSIAILYPYNLVFGGQLL